MLTRALCILIAAAAALAGCSSHRFPGYRHDGVVRHTHPDGWPYVTGPWGNAYTGPYAEVDEYGKLYDVAIYKDGRPVHGRTLSFEQWRQTIREAARQY